MGKKLRRRTLMCDLPEDVLLSHARITMMGRGSVLIEGQCALVELGSARIRLRTRGGIVIVDGQGLRLREISGDAALIDGERIDCVSYGG